MERSSINNCDFIKFAISIIGSHPVQSPRTPKDAATSLSVCGNFLVQGISSEHRSSPDSVVCTVAGLRAGNRGVWIRFPVGATDWILCYCRW